MAEKINLANVWQQRELGVGLPHLGSTNIELWCDRLYPFLQLVNVDAVFAADITPKFITAPAGWVIHDYGEALSVASSHDFTPRDGIIPRSSQSLAAQIDTVSEVAGLISNKEWEKVELIAGTAMMKRFLWIESKRRGFELTGYTPTVDDQKCYDLLKKQAEANGVVWQRVPKVSEQEDIISTIG